MWSMSRANSSTHDKSSPTHDTSMSCNAHTVTSPSALHDGVTPERYATTTHTSIEITRSIVFESVELNTRSSFGNTASLVSCRIASSTRIDVTVAFVK